MTGNTLSKFLVSNARSGFLCVVLLVLIVTFAHLNLRRPSLLITALDIQYNLREYGEEGPPHTPSQPKADLSKEPLRIYIPPTTSEYNPLDDIWDSQYHKEQLTKVPLPGGEPEAYHKSTDCPVCDTIPEAAQSCPEQPFDVSKCPNIDDYGSNVAHGASSPLRASTDKIASHERPLISYVYTETPSNRLNLAFFINHGLHDAADFAFILNGETDVDTAIIPSARKNIHIYKRPENDCFDLGAHAEILAAIPDNTSEEKALVDSHTRFILMNANVRGPFVPRWSQECWTEAFLGRVTDSVKLVGMGLSCVADSVPHVQTDILATDITGLRALLEPEGINECFVNQDSYKAGQMRVTELMRRKIFETDVLSGEWPSEKEYRYLECKTDEKNFVGIGDDGNGNGDDNGTSPLEHNSNPYETLFVEMNGEEKDSLWLESLSRSVGKRGYSSYQACKKYSETSE